MKTAKTITLLLLLLPSPLWALASDGDQPIEVEADSLEIREAENISIYVGNVNLVQGSLKIKADRLVIHFNELSDLTLMEMTGAPARFRLLDNDNKEMLGQAVQIDYTERESLLELRGTARFNYAGDTIESELIRINTEKNSILAGTPESDQRVKMLIQPRQTSEPSE